MGDPAFNHAAERLDQRAVMHQGDDANKSGATLLDAVEPPQEPLVIKMRGIDPGRSAERVHFDPRIVGEQIAADARAVIDSLGAGVLLESPAVLFGRGDGDGT